MSNRIGIIILCLSFLLVSCEKADKQKKVVIPDAVDLGLSVKWASFDVGATKPGEIGEYFSWGELEPKTSYFVNKYLWCSDSRLSLTKYNYNAKFGANPDNMHVLLPEDDVAHVRYGGGWRMPTAEEIKELIECPFLKQSIEKVGPISCLKLTSTKTGNSILLPPGGKHQNGQGPIGDSGSFWSSELHYTTAKMILMDYDPFLAMMLQVTPWDAGNETFLCMSTHAMERNFGLNVRAVTK